MPATPERDAFDDLFAAVYAHLREIAHRYMLGQRRGHTLSTTALVSRAYEKMVGGEHLSYADRKHFLRTAAQAMRQILVDYARQKSAIKRGGGLHPITLDDDIPIDDRIEGLIDLNDALEKMKTFNPEGTQVVELRYFGGLTEKETADVLGMSERTVRRKWSAARAWLQKELTEGPAPPEA